ncbi:TPA: conjugal transfer protein, partial [Salmonella enterica subsp. enterica serovar Enteritidis]
RKPDTTDADHDKRIAENYVYDEVLGINVPRSEFEKRAKFNNDQTSPEASIYGNESDHDKTVRFPSRPKDVQTEIDKYIDLIPSSPSEYSGKSHVSKLRPLAYRNNNYNE